MGAKAGWRSGGLRRLAVKRLTPSTGRSPAKAATEPARLAPEIAQLIDLVAEILLEQRRRQANHGPPVESA